VGIALECLRPGQSGDRARGAIWVRLSFLGCAGSGRVERTWMLGAGRFVIAPREGKPGLGRWGGLSLATDDWTEDVVRGRTANAELRRAGGRTWSDDCPGQAEAGRGTGRVLTLYCKHEVRVVLEYDPEAASYSACVLNCLDALRPARRRRSEARHRGAIRLYLSPTAIALSPTRVGRGNGWVTVERCAERGSGHRAVPSGANPAAGTIRAIVEGVG